MSGPIRVSVNVIGDSPIKVDARVPHRTQKIDVKAPIIQGEDTPEYEGPYTVEPTEQIQILDTDGHKMTDDVTVGAVPPDYVGSGVVRRDSYDLIKTGSTINVPAGYYPASATKDVENGVRGNRVNTIGYSGTKKTYKISYPDATSGYYASAIVKEPGQFELERQQETVTPTESAQEVTPTNSLYYLEKVTVNPIPTDYGKIEQNGSVLTIS